MSRGDFKEAGELAGVGDRELGVAAGGLVAVEVRLIMSVPERTSCTTVRTVPARSVWWLML